ncbi:hypothetical protein GF318_02575 [Candidatus Micrarchaeota archaeon]|nr:hypothetical protein [Candidatus Micrarchaeota archaeon]
MTAPARQLRQAELTLRQGQPSALRPRFKARRPSAEPPFSGCRDKKVCIVSDDADYHSTFGLVEELMGKSQTVKAMNWSLFLHRLPSMKDEVVIIMSPGELGESFDALKQGLESFRKNNPGSTVIINSLHNSGYREGAVLGSLLKEGLVDHVQQGLDAFPGVAKENRKQAGLALIS